MPRANARTSDDDDSTFTSCDIIESDVRLINNSNKSSSYESGKQKNYSALNNIWIKLFLIFAIIGTLIGIFQFVQPDNENTSSLPFQSLSVTNILDKISPSSHSQLSLQSSSSSSSILPQNKIGVCILFNWDPSDAALDTIFKYQISLHSHVLLMGPTQYSNLSSHAQQLISNHSKEVSYIAVPEQDRGYCQQYSLQVCLRYFDENKSSLPSMSGVMYMADDQYFDWSEIFAPRCVDENINISEDREYKSFTSKDYSRIRFQYPLDEFWYQAPSLLMYDMTTSDPKPGDWHWMLERDGFINFNKTYWAMPEKWRDTLSEISGKKHHVMTFGVADMVYVPFHSNQLKELLSILNILNTQVTPNADIKNTTTAAGILKCAISETLFNPLIHLAMVASGRPPLMPKPNSGAFRDVRWATDMYWVPTGEHKNKAYFYEQLLKELKIMKLINKNNPQWDGQLRPVPIRWDGYNWNRDDQGWLEWAMIKGDGDPIMLHPLKLSDVNSLHTRLYRLSQAHVLFTMLEFQRSGAKCRKY